MEEAGRTENPGLGDVDVSDLRNLPTLVKVTSFPMPERLPPPHSAFRENQGCPGMLGTSCT